MIAVVQPVTWVPGRGHSEGQSRHLRLARGAR